MPAVDTVAPGKDTSSECPESPASTRWPLSRPTSSWPTSGSTSWRCPDPSERRPAEALPDEVGPDGFGPRHQPLRIRHVFPGAGRPLPGGGGVAGPGQRGLERLPERRLHEV